MSVVIDHVSCALPGDGEVPGRKVSNHELIEALGGKERVGGLTPEKFEKVFGIRSRRLMSPVNPNTGKPAYPEQIDEIGMATTATARVFEKSNLIPEDIDALFFITATQKKARFNEASMELIRQSGLTNLSLSDEMAVGCGGFGVALVQSTYILRGSPGIENVLIVASHCPSKHINAELYAEEGEHINELLFGDGAAAALIRGVESSSSGIKTIYSDIREDAEIMTATNMSQGVLYSLDEYAAGHNYSKFIKETYRLLLERSETSPDEIDRHYFHQVNGNKLDGVLDELGIPHQLAPKHVDWLGNLSAASTPILTAEDLKDGKLQRGDKIMFNVMGAASGANAAGAIGTY